MKLTKRRIVIMIVALLGLVLVGILISYLAIRSRSKISEFDYIYPKKPFFKQRVIVSKTKDEYEKIKDEPVLVEEPETNISMNNLSYWLNWNWEDKIAKFEIVEVSKDMNSVNARMILPVDSIYGTDVRTYNINCNVEDTIVTYRGGRDEMDKGKNEFKPAMDVLTSGDLFYAYCLESECSTLGKTCIIER